MPKLVYFGIGGRAEPIRLLLTHAKVEFEDIRLTFPEFGELKAKGKFPAGQVPIWITDDGRELNQSTAILRALGAQYGYYGGGFDEIFEVNWVLETIGDLAKSEVIGVFFKDGEVAPEVIANLVGAFSKHLGFIEEKLRRHGKHFLTGEKITIADFAIFSLLSTLVFNKNVKSAALGEALAATVTKEMPSLT